MRERLKEVLRQYELRERHFECVIRSKELEVLLSRARAAEQKQLAESEKVRADRAEEEAQTSRKQLEAAQSGQTMLIDKLIACCKEVRSISISISSQVPCDLFVCARMRYYPISSVLTDTRQTAQRRTDAADIRVSAGGAGEEGDDTCRGWERRGRVTFSCGAMQFMI